MPTTFIPRPRTAIQDEVEDWEEDDDDPGLFSFLPPATTSPPSQNSPSLSSQPPTISHHNTPSNQQPPSSQHTTNFHTPPSSNPNSPAIDQGITPAAAYAIKVQDGPRKRGSWVYPESPVYTISTPKGGGRPQRCQESALGYELGQSNKSNTSGLTDSTAWETYHADDISMQALGKGSHVLEKMDSRGSLSDTNATTIEVPYYADAGIEDEDSPYPEVRASVSNLDDPEMPCLTFRSWFLGLFFSATFGAINMFFNFRYPAPIMLPIVVQVACYPLGKFLAFILPTAQWRVPNILKRIGFSDTCSFNPGPFNIKEHSVILIMTNTSISPGTSLNFSVTIRLYYGIDFGPWFDVLLLMSTQMVGFGIAGLARRFLVWPASMIWPQNLVYCTLLNTLHAEEDDEEGGGVTRFKFFLYVFAGAFAWYFLPGFLFQALSAFSFICWAAPNNVVVNQLFGVYSGLGMGLFTFDWSQIAYLGSPLVTPWWAEVNIFIGFFVAYWVIAPIFYYTNVWYTGYLPMSTSAVFDRFGQSYNTSAVIDPITHRLDLNTYQSYSPVYLPITFALAYGLALAISTACLVHTALYHGKDIWNQLKTRTKVEDEDVHAKLMRNYPEVPDSWYMLMLFSWVGVSIGVVAGWATNLPVWSLLLGLLISFIYVLPAGYVFAMTGQQISINLIVELVAGYLMPGNPVGVMLFKIYGTQSFGLGLAFIQDLKIGHYMKIPPRVTFASQVVATAVSCVAQLGVAEWLMSNVSDFCTDHQAALLSCPFVTVFQGSGVIWGLIGPVRMFGIGKIYNPLLWWFLVGAVLPICFWMLERRFPKRSWLSYVNVPVMLAGGVYMPPATGINYSSWFVVGFIFQFWMRRRFFNWWSKYNFVLSAGMDSGTAISGLFIFFALQLPKMGTLGVQWWGNSIFTTTADWNGVSYLPMPDEGFGPTTW